MQVTVESSAGLERRMHVQLPEDRVSSEVDKRLSELSRSARLPGFRPGKIPIKVVRQRYGRQVREEVVGELVQSSFYDALVQESLRPAGSPKIEPDGPVQGEGVNYVATFDVYPDVALPDLGTLQISRPVANVEDADVEQMIETLRRQRRTFTSVERAATSSDRVVVDFAGFKDGSPVENAKGEDFPVELDSGRMIPGFEDALVGTSAGETKSVELTFPQGYQASELAGQAVTFEFTIKGVEEPTLPQVDDEFVSGFGISEGGADGLRAEVRANMSRELTEAIRNVTKQRTMDALLASNNIELPQSLIDEECQQALERRKTELSHSGVEPEAMALTAEMFTEQATTRVSLGLLLAEVIRENDIKPDPQRVSTRIQTIASTYEQPEEVVRWYMGNKERLSEIETSVLEEQVVEWVLDRAEVVDEQSSFEALMKPPVRASIADS
ncbi:MAG: trigger factor [Gammaproteobacteria bacterium]|jgi:trigger factor